MSAPRALRGPVMAMARPARPASEIAAVKAAAVIVRAETGLRAAEAVARVIAARVIIALIAELERDPDDPLAEALVAVQQRLFQSPFLALATDPEANLFDHYIRLRMENLRENKGRYLTPEQFQQVRKKICARIMTTIATRYARLLREPF